MSDTITPRLRIKAQADVSVRAKAVPPPKVRLRVIPSLLPMQIELQNTGIMVQWRYLGQDWQDLIAIDDLDTTVTVGSVTTLPPGSSATVVNVGTAKDMVLNFGIPAGVQGIQGIAATVAAGSTTTVNAGTPAAVVNVGTPNDAVFNFSIPQGPAATVAVGTVTTLAPGAAATVVNVGTSGAAVLNFGIPQGAAGVVTAVSIASANGLAGSSSGGATPALTLSTTVNAPILAGNGTAIGAATTTGTGSTAVLSVSPALTGTPTAPTPAVDTNTTQVATTAMVLGQAAAAAPLGDKATAAVGSSTRYARADHVHPGRELLTGARTYYVRADGNNSNTGLVNSAGGAFLTIQKALDVVYGTLDLGGFNVTIQVVGGPYTVGGSQTSPQVGAGTVTILGDTTTPSNVAINVTSANAISVSGAGTKLALGGLKLTAATSGTLLNATSGGQIDLTGKMDFGAAATEAISIAGGVVNSIGISHTISGSTPIFVDSSNGKFLWFGGTTTLTGTPAFSAAFAYAQNIGFAQISGVTFSGAATGSRYSSNSNSVIQTFGSGASYLPGNAVGATGTGGIYA